jgi:hypothetical protein
MRIIKIKILLILTLLFSSSLFGQLYKRHNTYLDALELAKIRDSFFSIKTGIEEGDTISLKNDFNMIVGKYGNISELLSNPFLRQDVERFLSEISQQTDSINGQNGKIGYKRSSDPSDRQPANLQSSAINGANWQASAINGIANFMAGHFKQEILHVAIDQIFKQIRTKEDSILVKSIFPKTFKQIGDLYGSGSSSYYTADLLLLRKTVQIDLEQLPKNIINKLDAIFPKLNHEPKIIKDMLKLGYYIVEYSKQGTTLDRLLSLLANESYSSDSTIYKILNVADLISQAMLNKEGSKDIWVNPVNITPTASSLKNLEIKYFYGLLYQQLIQIPELKNYIEKKDSDDTVSIAIRIHNLLRFVNILNNTYKFTDSKGFNLKSPEEIVTYIKGINQTISYFFTTLKNDTNINKSYKINDTILDISAKYITIVEALILQDYQKVIPMLIIEFGKYMDKNVKSTRTIAFLSQLATIESADDMEALLNAYALPIGSSSIKRRSSFDISVNGYVGLTGGLEIAYRTQIKQPDWNIGLSAPIGISATLATCLGHVSLFMSIIDLGSIVNQRLHNDTTSYSNIKFEHFFTPGIGVFFNCPKLPITAGVHFNYIPNLRTIKYESGGAIITESNRSVTRINISLLVDIPFFTLYNKPKIE